MKFSIAFAAAAMLCHAQLAAAPAPWYKWRSKLDGVQFCAQVSPGEGWERIAVPYQDARCQIPATPRR